MNDKSTKNQMDLLSFFEGGKSHEDQNQDSKTSGQSEVDILDFNTDGDTSGDTGEASSNGKDADDMSSNSNDGSPTESEALLIPMSTTSAGIPIFEYAGASEPIKNLRMTFEDLRKEKSKDFPELEKKEKVTWAMDYGVLKTVVDTGKTIAQVKVEIEGSKEFLEALKKSRKPVVCKVKPRVSGQTKGVVSAYKGVFTNLEDVAKAKKIISILPSRDGRVYELRNTEIGLFVTRTKDVEELDPIVPCFRMKLPRIPVDILHQVIAFFRSYVQKDYAVEAMVNLLWDREEMKYTVHVPEQRVSKTSVKASPSDFDDGRYLHVADIHSHNTMPAGFSVDDNDDEKATRLYFVIGKLDRYFPDIRARIANGGKFHPIDSSDALESIEPGYPDEWHARVTITRDTPKDDTGFTECGAA